MSGATLKKTALITMLIDHIGAAFFYIFTSSYDGIAAFAGADICYQILRIIGRTSFPIFCFLLVEGFIHTRSVKKYLCRLILFAALSEIPFDLAFYDKVWDVTMQNVFLTLVFGLLAITSVRWGEEMCSQQTGMWKGYMFAGFVGALGCCMGAWLLRTDYGATGVVLILIWYLPPWYACTSRRSWS